MPAPNSAQIAKSITVAAPTGGLNAVNSLAAMPPTDCIVMDNWLPQPSYVSMRNGYTLGATGFPGWVETILCYSGTSEKIFGISGTAVYDGTAAGPVGAAVVTGLTNARWEYVNVATAGGQFLYAANATDAPLLYDGTNWTKITGSSSPAITGVTTTTLRNPVVWKNRVWFVQDNTLNAWYLPTASIGGAASQFPLTAIFRKGGTLRAIITASLTDGSTFDQYIAFLTTEGELALYTGVDPAQAGLFILQGMYDIGKPVGRRCWFKYGEDAIIICSDGFVSLSKLISIGRINSTEAISYKILNLVNNDVAAYGNNFGWQGALHPLGNKVLINVPQNENNTQYQYVMNTITNSWCRFTNWNFTTLEVQANTLYGGGNTYIAIADTGHDDNGEDIIALMKTAFSYLGTSTQKFITMCRPLIQTDGVLNVSLNINMDFSDTPPMNQGTYISSAGPPWDTSPWDTTAWGSGLTTSTYWKTVYGEGFAAALYIGATAQDMTVNLQAIDYVWETGGIF